MMRTRRTKGCFKPVYVFIASQRYVEELYRLVDRVVGLDIVEFI